jgi:hypothetical protein
MEAENYLASGFATRLAIEGRRSGWKRFDAVAKTWQPSRLKGITVSPEYGVPFLAATQVFDLRPVPRKWLSLERTSDDSKRFVAKGMALITCSGTVGRATLADKSLDGVLISHDLLRVEARDAGDWGWIYGYLRAPTVRAMMTSARYGHMIKHLEVSHLDAMPFIEAAPALRAVFAKMAKAVVSARDRAHDLALKAEDRLLREIAPSVVESTKALGFTVSASATFCNGRRLDASYHNPIARFAEEAVITSGWPVQRLGDLVERIFIPGRFKHVYGPDGIPYLDSAQILEVAPDVEKYVLSLQHERRAGYLVASGTLLLPCSGQLHGIIGQVVLAGGWHQNKVLTNHIMRIIPKSQPDVRIGYLQAVIGHPILGRPRVLKGAYGSSVPELSALDIENMAIPRLSSVAETEIADAMEDAAALSAKANEVEDKIAEEAETIVRAFLVGATGERAG